MKKPTGDKILLVIAKCFRPFQLNSVATTLPDLVLLVFIPCSRNMLHALLSFPIGSAHSHPSLIFLFIQWHPALVSFLETLFTLPGAASVSAPTASS